LGWALAGGGLGLVGRAEEDIQRLGSGDAGVRSTTQNDTPEAPKVRAST